MTSKAPPLPATPDATGASAPRTANPASSDPSSTAPGAAPPGRVKALSGLLPFVRPYRGRVAWAGFFLVMAALSTLAFPVALKVLIDQGLVAADPGQRLMALRDGVIPPTLNLRNLDPEIDLDVVAGEPRTGDYRYAVNNSFGFGGHNVAIAFGKY